MWTKIDKIHVSPVYKLQMREWNCLSSAIVNTCIIMCRHCITLRLLRDNPVNSTKQVGTSLCASCPAKWRHQQLQQPLFWQPQPGWYCHSGVLSYPTPGIWDKAFRSTHSHLGACQVNRTGNLHLFTTDFFHNQVQTFISWYKNDTKYYDFARPWIYSRFTHQNIRKTLFEKL